MKLSGSAVLLQGYAADLESELHSEIKRVINAAPLRHMETPGGRAMSAAMTNCGQYGWITDRRGYRYVESDPVTGMPWPDMPAILSELAEAAAEKCGFKQFNPDVCLINCYRVGARMGAHQDRDEKDFDWPIVSVSLGIPAVFLWGGFRRRDKQQRIPLHHGDVVVWGGADRLRYHGILPVKPGHHPLFGEYRYNLTFRCAG